MNWKKFSIIYFIIIISVIFFGYFSLPKSCGESRFDKPIQTCKCFGKTYWIADPIFGSNFTECYGICYECKTTEEIQTHRENVYYKTPEEPKKEYDPYKGISLLDAYCLNGKIIILIKNEGNKSIYDSDIIKKIDGSDASNILIFKPSVIESSEWATAISNVNYELNTAYLIKITSPTNSVEGYISC